MNRRPWDTILYYAPVHTRTGYGTISRAYIRALHEAGLPVVVRSIGWTDPDIPPEDATLLEKLESAPVVGNAVAIFHTTPSEWAAFTPITNLVQRINISMFETDRVPAEWIPFLNQFDQIWTPTEFHRDTYVRSGVRSELLRIIPFTHPWIDSPQPAPANPPNGVFRFLNISEFTPRKRLDILLSAYFQEFTAAEPAQFYLKITYPKWKDAELTERLRQEFSSLLLDLEKQSPQHANLIVDETLGTPQELRTLVTSANVYVSTDGGGYNLPIIETMACGRVAATVDWSGGGDLVSSDFGYRIPVSAQTVPVPESVWSVQPLCRDHQWADIRVEDVRRILRRAYECAPQERRRMGEAAREFCRQRMSGPTVAAQMVESLSFQPELQPLDNTQSLKSLADSIKIMLGDKRDISLQEIQDASSLLNCLLTTNNIRRRLDERADEVNDVFKALLAIHYEAAQTNSMPAQRDQWLFLFEAVKDWLRNKDQKTAASHTREAAPPTSAPSLLRETIPCVWVSSVFGRSGYAAVARNTLLGLNRAGYPLAVVPLDTDLKVDFDPETLRTLWQLTKPQPQPNSIFVFHHPPADHVGRDLAATWRAAYPGMSRYICNSMFETDRIPASWVDALNGMDEVWVPTQFNRQTYTRAGVIPQKIRTIPYGIDPKLFTTQVSPRRDLFSPHKFNFISVFEWTRRKGWEILLKAFLDEFAPSENVALNLVVYRGTGTNGQTNPAEQAHQFIRAQLGYSLDQIPTINFIEAAFSHQQIPALYAAADAFVLPSHGEGWGMPYMEAMAMGLPTIGTCWSGNLEFMNEANSYLIEIDGLAPVDQAQVADNPYYAGHLWAEPNLRHLRQLMRRVVTNQDEAKEVGLCARDEMLSKWTIDEAAKDVIKVLKFHSPSRHRQSNIARAIEPLAPITWLAPFYDPSGYGDEARHFITQLHQRGFEIGGISIGRSSESFRQHLDPATQKLLRAIVDRTYVKQSIAVTHFPATSFEKIDDAAYQIGRVMFETDSLPAHWVERCNLMDELWLPTEFNLETFRRAGVTTRLTKIHGGIDTQCFHPRHKPLEIPEARGTVFLSIFEWSYRKGWDVLLQAWANAFTAQDDVCLVLRVYPLNSIDTLSNQIVIERYINTVIEEGLQRQRADLAPIIVLGDPIGEDDFPRLFTAAHCYVAPSRGEGWGRPHMQAMASALPVIATRWSGNLEFMNDDNSLLLQATAPVEIDQREEINFYWGQHWSEPSVEHLSELMQWVHTHRDEAKQIGARARRDMIQHWQWSHVANQAAQRLQEIQNELHQRRTMRHFTLRWEGDQLRHSSLGLINREVCTRLMQRGHEIALQRTQPDQFTSSRFELLKQGDAAIARDSHPIEVHVAHQYPPRFDPPREGHWVMSQPWEFGSLPKEWIEKMNASVDEVWTPTHFARECYVQSGLDPQRVFVVPNGVNTDLFNPYIESVNLPTTKKFKFLFVGGTIWRKGIDLLLEAYLQAFTRNDDVCLVIKDVGGGSFYQDQNFSTLIQQAQQDPNAPQIVYLDVDLNPDDLPRLYTACDCLVHPYRGEGFGLPIAEAMSCALPVIVTGAGASQDFCNNENAYLLSAQKRALDHTHATGRETVNAPFVYEPNVAEIVTLMRHVVNHQEEAKAKGARAREEICAHFTWDHAVKQIEERLTSLIQKPIRRAQTTVAVDPQLSAAFAQGDAAIGEGDWSRAAAIFKKIANDHPQLAEAHHALGSVYLAQNDPSRAIKALRRALRCAPNEINLQNQLGVAYFKNSEFTQAADTFGEALQIAPKHLITLLNLVAVHQAQKQFAPAATYIKQALGVAPDNPDVLSAFANLSLEIGNHEAAQMALEKLKDVAPEHPSLQLFAESLAA